jgi:hypothetical protein
MRRAAKGETVTEDREKTSGEDREQNIDDVEGHSLPGSLVGQTAGQHIDATDDDEPDVEAHSLPGMTGGEPSDSLIGANTGEPTDQNTGG